MKKNQLTFRQTDNHHHCTYHDRHGVAFPHIGGDDDVLRTNCFERITNILIPSKKNFRNGRSAGKTNGRLLSWWNTYVHFSATIHDDDDICNTYVNTHAYHTYIWLTIMYNPKVIAAANVPWQLPPSQLPRFQTCTSLSREIVRNLTCWW